MLECRFISSLETMGSGRWNDLVRSQYPFLRDTFLSALEHAGAVGTGTGWQTCHALVTRNGQPVAAMPLYLKDHSYGEYVFDHAWADAYHRHSMDYYPKLVTAVPFTPVAGQRLCIAEGEDQAAIISLLVSAVDQRLAELGASSWHVLFPDQALADTLADRGLLLRRGVQFHWHNRGYRDFDDFLDGFSSRKRKAVKKERERVAQQGLTLSTYEGRDITPRLWDHFFTFYQMTYAKRSGHGGYLNREFFARIGEHMPEQLVMVIARHGGDIAAGALSFRDQDTLYGRYWGCTREYEYLHFEACYYQGIEYCIERGLARFDSGAQGEHKIQRGFEPIETYSAHRIAHPDFRRAIAGFLDEERQYTDRYRVQAAAMLPFKS